MTPADLIRRARERLTRCGTPADEDMIAALADALESHLSTRHEYEEGLRVARDAAIKRAEAAEMALRNVLGMALRMRSRRILDAEHLIRFCREAGVVSTVLREAGEHLAGKGET